LFDQNGTKYACPSHGSGVKPSCAHPKKHASKLCWLQFKSPLLVRNTVNMIRVNRSTVNALGSAFAICSWITELSNNSRTVASVFAGRFKFVIFHSPFLKVFGYSPM
jgi:hypothetical protein